MNIPKISSTPPLSFGRVDKSAVDRQVEIIKSEMAPKDVPQAIINLKRQVKDQEKYKDYTIYASGAGPCYEESEEHIVNFGNTIAPFYIDHYRTHYCGDKEYRFYDVIDNFKHACGWVEILEKERAFKMVKALRAEVELKIADKLQKRLNEDLSDWRLVAKPDEINNIFKELKHGKDSSKSDEDSSKSGEDSSRKPSLSDSERAEAKKFHQMIYGFDISKYEAYLTKKYLDEFANSLSAKLDAERAKLEEFNDDAFYDVGGYDRAFLEKLYGSGSSSEASSYDFSGGYYSFAAGVAEYMDKYLKEGGSEANKPDTEA